MRVIVTLTGVSPLLCHNIHLANPDNSWAKAIAGITKKRKKTEEDRQEIARLEWFGSLYTHKNTVVIPTANFVKCLIETAKVTREGRSVARAVSIIEPNAQLIYSGPETPEALWKVGGFVDSTLVGVGRQRVVRTRPIFRGWMLRIELELLTAVMDYASIVKVINMAGKVEGLGDNRVNGMGRFTAEIKSVDEMQEAA